MEQEGVLESDWELENSGPARKRYTLTEKGGHCLDQWMRTLTSHQAFIANLLLFLQDARSGMNSEPCPMPEHSVSLYPQEVFLSAFSTRLLRLRDTSTFCRSRTYGHLFFH